MSGVDVLCAGEAAWDLVAPPGLSFAGAESLQLRPGGAAVNVALELAAIGLLVGLRSTVGDDALGHALQARIAALGVDTAGMAMARERTGLCFIEGTAAGRRVVGYLGPEPPRGLGDGWRARALLVTGLPPGKELWESWRGAARQVRERGGLVVVDVNARARAWAGRDRGTVWGLLGAADMVKMSTDDLVVLGMSEQEAAAALAQTTPQAPVLVVTDGPRPARAIGRYGVVESPPEPIERPDCTGAGDAFMAGLVADALEGALGRQGGGTTDEPAAWERALISGHARAAAHLTRR